MKIVLIGPVYPFKGGISHYTGLLYRSLSKSHDVTMLSFKMQYPKILFKKEQRDYSNDSFKIEDTDYQINTANPFNWISTVRKINKIAPNLVIFQWWHPYFAPCFFSICKGIKKHTKILFTCHNVFPHERFPMDRTLAKAVLKQGDYYIVQSKMDEQDLESIKPGAKHKVAVHPTYNAFKFEDMSKEKARELIGIDNQRPVILFFGFVREYKGLKHLINAIPKVLEKKADTLLLIVGDFAGDKEQYTDLIKEKAISDNVAIYDGYIPDKEVEKYFAASDAVVLPYESATQSGIVQIAYGFEKPVIATNVGGLPEVVLNEKTGYVVQQGDDEELANKIVDFFEQNKAEEFKENIQLEAYKYSWDRMNEHIEALYGEN